MKKILCQKIFIQHWLQLKQDYNNKINNSEKLTIEGLERSESGTGLKNSEEFTHPPHNPCFKKKEGGEKGEGEGRGDVMPFIDCPKSNKPNWHTSC